MPISRPMLIVLVAAVVALVGFYATQGARQSSDDVSAPVAQAPEVAATPPAAKAPAKPKAERKRAGTAGVPIAVERALDARKRVVLFFYKPGSADDRATGQAVDGLRGTRGLAVFTDPIGRLAKYRGLIGELGIAQAPAVVIVGKDRSARVIQGYVDPATLAQDVADTR
jgi:hypothetical protein